MSEEVVYDGVGTTLTLGTTGVTFDIEKITPPGKSRKLIEMTGLGNAKVTTKKLGKLWDWKPLNVTAKLDPDKTYNTNFAANELATITFPDSLGALAVYAGVSEVTPGEIAEGNKSTVDLVINLTNLDDSNVETEPAFTA